MPGASGGRSRRSLHLVAVVADEVDRLLDLADRLHARLADLEQAGAGNLVFLALDAIGGAAQHRDALGPRPAAPVRIGGAGGRDGAVDRAARGGKEAAERPVAVDRGGRRVTHAVLILAAGDEIGPRPPEEICPHRRQECIEMGVNAREILGDVRIGHARQGRPAGGPAQLRKEAISAAGGNALPQLPCSQCIEAISSAGKPRMRQKKASSALQQAIASSVEATCANSNRNARACSGDVFIPLTTMPHSGPDRPY